MSKKIDELLPSDTVMIEVGPRTQYNKDNGKLETIEPGKVQPVTYGYFLALTQTPDGKPVDEYDEETGYSKTVGRTVKLAGLAEYEDAVTERGDAIKTPVVKEFATDASRAAAKAAADKAQKEKEKADAEAEKKAKDAEKAKADFEAEEKKKAEAEQDKTKVAADAAKDAANKPA